MFKLLVLLGLGVAGFVVVKKVTGRDSAAIDADDLYGSADIHRSTD